MDDPLQLNVNNGFTPGGLLTLTMSRKMLSVIISVFFFSCANNSNRVSENLGLGDSKIENKLVADSLLRKCINENDTTIDEKTSIKYVVLDSFYTLSIQIKGLDTLLPYRFNCSTPRGLVPSLYSINNNAVCLIRGAGQHYREFIICYVDGSSLYVKNFETALSANLEKNIVVYQNVDSANLIYIEDIKTSGRKSYIVPSGYLSANITQAILRSNTLEVRFSDDKVLKLVLR